MPKPRKSAPVVVYSAQASVSEKFPIAYANGDPGAIIDRVTVDDAAAQVKAGHARWLRGGTAIQLRDLARGGRQASQSGIRRHEMFHAANGDGWARGKVDAWGALQRANIAALVVQA